MNLIEAIVLGIVQGLTEFLPISSSAHQRIVPAFLGWEDPGAAFTAVTQLGTEAAVLIYFRHELWAIATTWLRALRDPALRSDPNARIGWYLIVATIPIGIFRLLFENQIENGARNLWLIGSVLIIFASSSATPTATVATSARSSSSRRATASSSASPSRSRSSRACRAPARP